MLDIVRVSGLPVRSCGKGGKVSAYDLVIRAGTVVDGNGGPPRTADVAITGGVIAEVGPALGRGRREVGADGALVTPGFVDIHTHYDGQATWDERLLPSSWHGVTTAVMGNCGVGFAPATPGHRQRLIELMEGIEDIPGTALHAGLRWDWETFDQFLCSLAMRPHDIDFATQVPHAALRVHVMGERALAAEAATPDDVAAMAGLARAGVEAGALGFTTSRTLNHRSVTGELTPTYDADVAEVAGIAAGLGASGRGVLQLVADFLDVQADLDVILAMARASGRPVSVSLIEIAPRPGAFRQVLSGLAAASEEGLVVRAQVAARAIGLLMGLQCTLHPFMTNPVWREIAGRPPAEQARVMRGPAVKAAVLAAQTDARNRNLIGGALIHKYELMYELTDPPSYEPDPGDTIAARAAREGRAGDDLAYDILTGDEGRAMLYVTAANYVGGSLDSVHEMLAHPCTLPGLSDGGAHVGTISDGSFPTTLLAHWARDRRSGRFPVEYIVQRQARDTARAVGLGDRGVLAPGYRADVNVIDLDRLGLRRPEMHFDLPGGGRRLLQRAEGYLHTFVRGQETYAAGEPTGALPGRLVRGAQPAPAGS
jgi:N-acyl-D-aspartate/D-glutamate deacylase